MQPKRYLYFYSFFFFFFFLGWDRLFRGRHTVTFKCFSLFHFCFSRSDEAVACAAQEQEEKKNVLSVDGVEMKICLFQNNNSTIHPLLTTNRKEEEECLFLFLERNIYLF